MMDKSWAPGFRELVFKKIDERQYTELYSDVDSRPNFPVNIWVGLEIIKGMFMRRSIIRRGFIRLLATAHRMTSRD